MDYYKIKIAVWIVLLIISFYCRWQIQNSKNDQVVIEKGQIAGAKIDPSEFANIDFDVSHLPRKNKEIGDPPVYAKSVILMDGATGYPLYQKNAHSPLPIASTTKIMTAVIALENIKDFEEVVTISREAALQIGHKIDLRWNEKIKIKNLLSGLLIASGNDAAYGLAETVGANFSGEGKPVEKFVAKMNEKAKYLGIVDTEFKDPAGLDDSGHSSAFDLAILASYGLRNEKFSKIVRTKEADICSFDGLVCHHLKNSNRLVGEWDYPGAIGVKTGFTPEAGHCLVGAAERNGHRLISVILYTNEFSITASASESRKLLDWGFNNWQWE